MNDLLSKIETVIKESDFKGDFHCMLIQHDKTKPAGYTTNAQGTPFEKSTNLIDSMEMTLNAIRQQIIRQN